MLSLINLYVEAHNPTSNHFYIIQDESRLMSGWGAYESDIVECAYNEHGYITNFVISGLHCILCTRTFAHDC